MFDLVQVAQNVLQGQGVAEVAAIRVKLIEPVREVKGLLRFGRFLTGNQELLHNGPGPGGDG